MRHWRPQCTQVLSRDFRPLHKRMAGPDETASKRLSGVVAGPGRAADGASAGGGDEGARAKLDVVSREGSGTAHWKSAPNSAAPSYRRWEQKRYQVSPGNWELLWGVIAIVPRALMLGLCLVTGGLFGCLGHEVFQANVHMQGHDTVAALVLYPHRALQRALLGIVRRHCCGALRRAARNSAIIMLPDSQVILDGIVIWYDMDGTRVVVAHAMLETTNRLARGDEVKTVLGGAGAMAMAVHRGAMVLGGGETEGEGEGDADVEAEGETTDGAGQGGDADD